MARCWSLTNWAIRHGLHVRRYISSSMIGLTQKAFKTVTSQPYAENDAGGTVIYKWQRKTQKNEFPAYAISNLKPKRWSLQIQIDVSSHHTETEAPVAGTRTGDQILQP